MSLSFKNTGGTDWMVLMVCPDCPKVANAWDELADRLTEALVVDLICASDTDIAMFVLVLTVVSPVAERG